MADGATRRGMTEGRYGAFESETRLSQECHVCGAESPRVWRCIECGTDLVGRAR